VIVGGVDEAGRGPVIGPMVMVLAVASEEKIDELKEIHVKDSKELSLEKREELYPEIKRILDDLVVIKIPPAEIDIFVERRGLNELEAMKTAQMLTLAKLRPDIVYIDAPDPDPRKYVGRISKYLENPPRIVAEHKADAKYPIVSAASIIAKVERDREIRKIEDKFGEFGTGYPHDERTIRFLEEWMKRNRELPDFVRKSWSTAKRIAEKGLQKTLFDWK